MNNIDAQDIPNNSVLSGNIKELPKWSTYDGNPSIKRANVKMGFEKWHLEEIIKCSNDINYFAANYVYIVNMDTGKDLIKLRDYQINLLDFMENNRFPVILASRQSGKSATVAIFMLHYILFNDDKKAIILANKADISKEIFAKLKISYEMLPPFLQVGVKKWQETSCLLENGSGASSGATTADGLRGITANLVLMDEMAFCRRSIADAFFTSMMPVISSGKTGRIIIVSTPNGLNHFYEIYQKGLLNTTNDPDEFNSFRIDWWEHPLRDEEWKEKEIKKIGKRRFAAEYGNEFLGSSSTLIEASILSSIKTKDTIDEDMEGCLRIFESPKPNHVYCAGIDTAKGTGGDYSVANVIDITSYPFRQVAIYRNNTLTTRKFADVVEKIGYMYNSAHLVVENNDIGHGVTEYLWHDLEYENLINYGGKRELGVRSTKKTKAVALDLLKEFIEDSKLEILDINTLYELSRFIEVRPGIFKAEDGEHDDCVTSLMWALFILKTNYIDKDDIFMSDDEIEEESEYDEEPLIPVIDNGASDENDTSWLTQ